VLDGVSSSFMNRNLPKDRSRTLLLSGEAEELDLAAGPEDLRHTRKPLVLVPHCAV
jgi:hypothetical protein